jgi:hypothetical protein
VDPEPVGEYLRAGRVQQEARPPVQRSAGNGAYQVADECMMRNGRLWDTARPVGGKVIACSDIPF